MCVFDQTRPNPARGTWSTPLGALTDMSDDNAECPPFSRIPRTLPNKTTQERTQDRARQQAWLKERHVYGKTPGGVHVDAAALAQLEGFGCERALAAEALRGAENDLQVGTSWRRRRCEADCFALGGERAAGRRNSRWMSGRMALCVVPRIPTKAD